MMNASERMVQMKARQGTMQNSDVVQRKVMYKNGGKAIEKRYSAELLPDVKEAVRGFLERNPKFHEQDKNIEKAAQLILEGHDFEVKNALFRMKMSDKDYGTYNLDDDQSVMLLIMQINRDVQFGALQEKAGPEARQENQTEIKDFLRADREKRQEQEAYFKKSPNPRMTYKLALLGTGASIAYYLESNKGSIDKLNTVAIGKQQPWAGQRGIRGAGGEQMHVNHPMHMISPDRSQMGSADERLAPRAHFSEVIEREIKSHVVLVFDTGIKKVEQVDGNGGAKFYQIETEKYGNIYAQHVVAGLGTGVQNELRNRGDLNKQFEEQHGQAKDLPRVMNMDEFQHNAPKISSAHRGQVVTIFISGGNAAIDTATRLVRENEKGGARFKMIWSQGSRGAQFLKGTDNEETQAKYQQHLAGQNPENAFQVRVKSVVKEGQQMKVTNDEDKVYYADYFINGTGQNFNPILNMFHGGNKEQFLKSLEPTLDQSGNFGEPGKVISGYEKRTQQGGLGAKYDTSTSLKFIGATASKLKDEVLRLEAGDGYSAAVKGKRDAQGKSINANIKSLPQNVVSQEQLAPIRASQESQSGYIPSYITREANFAVDNVTAIRLHIATKFPGISQQTADICASIIVRERQPSETLIQTHPGLVGPIPNPTGVHGRETAATYSEAVVAWLTRIEEREKHLPQK